MRDWCPRRQGGGLLFEHLESDLLQYISLNFPHLFAFALYYGVVVLSDFGEG